MNRPRILCALAFTLILPTGVRAIDVDNPPKGVFSDEWYAVMLQGKKCGHMHSVLERLERPGGDIVRTKTDMTLEMGRGGVNISVSVAERTTETLDGRPLSFSNVQRLGVLPAPMTKVGRITDGKVTVTSSQFGTEPVVETYDLPEGATMTWGLFREQMKRGFKPGTKYEASAYAPSVAADRLTPATVEVLGRETLDLFGRKVEAVKTRQILHIKSGLAAGTDVETITWLTEDGETLRVRMSMMNIPIEILACPQAVAMAKNEPAELMLDTLIDLGQPIDRNKAKQISYRITLKKNHPAGTRLPELPDTGMQTVDVAGRREVKITVTRRSARKQPHKTTPLTARERERYLAATSVVNYKDPVVADLVKKAVGNEKDPRKLAAKLTRFVGDHIADANLNVGFATASEVARSRQGDCSEHGVLLAALGRGAGIPTRAAFGVVYTDDFVPGRHVLGGHMWTQFYIDDEWVDLDAAFQQTDVDPTHIAFGLTDLGDGSFADMVGALWLTLGYLDVSIVKIDPPE